MKEDKIKKVIKSVLNFNKWFVVTAVFVLYISSAILALFGLVELYIILADFYKGITHYHESHYELLTADLLEIMDIYILSFVMFTTSISIYKLFIGNTNILKWLNIENLSDLKNHIAKMSVIFLTTLVIQKIAKWEDSKELLIFTISVTLICLVLILFIKVLYIEKNNIINK